MIKDGFIQVQKSLLVDILMRDDIDAFESLLQRNPPLNEVFTLVESELFENMTPLQAALKVVLLESGSSKILTRMLAGKFDLNINHVISEHKDGSFDLSGFTALTMVARFANVKVQCGLANQLIERRAEIHTNAQIALVQAVYKAIKENNFGLVDLFSRNGVRISQATLKPEQTYQLLKSLSLSKLKSLRHYGLSLDLDADEVIAALIANPAPEVLPYFEKEGLSKEKTAKMKLASNAAYNALLDDIQAEGDREIHLSHHTLRLMVNGLDLEQLSKLIFQLIHGGNVMYQGEEKTIAIQGAIPVMDMLRDCAQDDSKLDMEKWRSAMKHFNSQPLNEQDKEYILTVDEPGYARISKLNCNDLARLLNQNDIYSRMSNEARIISVAKLKQQDPRFEKHVINAEMHHMTKRVGHILGMDSNIIVTSGEHELTFKPGGHFPEYTLQDLIELLERYQANKPFDHIPEMIETVQYTAGLIDIIDYHKSASQKLFERYAQNKMVLISAGWSGHRISILIYQNMMVVCNRGDHGDKNYGALMYRFHKDFELTEENIASLMQYHATARGLLDIIDEMLETAKLVAEFSLQQQEHANCGFANSKSMLAAMLYLLARPPMQKSREMMGHFLMHYNHAQYKDITTFFRDQMIDEIIDHMGQSLRNPVLVQYYTSLLATLMDEKYQEDPQTVKAKADQQRLIKLYQNAPARIKSKLIQDPEYKKKLSAIYAHLHSFKVEEKETKKQNYLPSFLNKRPKVHPKVCRVSKPLGVRC